MSTAHKFTYRNGYRLVGAVSEPQRPPKAPMMCGKHPERKATWHANGKGFCIGCRQDAVAE